MNRVVTRSESYAIMENVEMEVAVTLNNLLDKVEIMVQGRKRKNYHKQVSCDVCKKSMRDDHVKRHMERKHSDISFECNNFLTTELLKNNAKYSQQLEMGSKIYDVLYKGLVKEESLKREHKQAFDIYRKQQSQINLDETELRPWQQDLLEKIKQPSDREVIWVRGFKGNEGKTWFQAYLESRYGYERVVRMDLKARQQDLLYALSRRPLCAADIFLFNVPRASEENDFCSYSTLEAIKDGTGTSTKYHTTPIRFRTPNIVMVFSNTAPVPNTMSRDRWSLYNIEGNKLVSITLTEWAIKNGKKKFKRDYKK